MSVSKSKKKKGKKKGGRSSSRASSRSLGDSDGDNNHLKPDYEAEEITSSRSKRRMELTNKSDQMKVNEKKKTDEGIAKTEEYNKDLADHKETKGFDTLMADDYDAEKEAKIQNIDENVKKATIKKTGLKRSKPRPKRFQK